MGVAFDGTLTPEQVDTYRKDGFLVIPDFASPDEVAGMLRRADELVEAFDPSSVPRSIFTTKDQKRTSDAYSPRVRTRHSLIRRPNSGSVAMKPMRSVRCQAPRPRRCRSWNR